MPRGVNNWHFVRYIFKVDGPVMLQIDKRTKINTLV